MGTTNQRAEGGKLRQLGKYELIARIAAGGMAEVFLARQLGMMNFQKVVVVKLIHPHLSREQQFVDMFLDEARISALIKHHNVVDIYDLGLDGDTYFIAMEYIAGQALSKVISRGAAGKRLDVFTTASIIANAATGLEAAHNLTTITGERVELVHRDVSPGNILVSYAGAVKLVDFGVSQSLSQLKTENTQLKGKIGYASPEQLEEAPLDHRSDLFSLGVVLWEALTLNRLYRAESPGATVRKILAGNPPAPSQLRPEVPAELDAITLKSLSLDPAERYQSAAAMRDELRALLREANYHGDERCVAEHMNEVFASERSEAEDLLRRVVSAEEEIRVDIDVDEEIGDIRSAELREAAAPVPRPSTNHDEELDAEIVVEDEAGGEPKLEAEAKPEAEADAKPEVEASPEPEKAAAPNPASLGTAATAADSLGPLVVSAPVVEISLTKKRNWLTVVLALAALAALAVIAVAIASGDGDETEKKATTEPEPIEAPAAGEKPEPDAGVAPEMIGVPPAATEKIVGEEVKVQSARLLYLDGWRLYSEGKGSEARVQYRAALRKVEGFPPALRGLGISYTKENRRQKARYYLRKYIEAAPSAPDTEEMRALLATMTP